MTLKRKIIVLLSMVLLVCSCSSSSNSQEKGDAKMEENNSDIRVRYLALGDSYTIGESVSEIERWPVQLAIRLRARSFKVGEPLIIARTGWTTDELIQGIEDSNVEGTFDLVSLLIGVNNQYRGRSAEEFRLEFRDLLDISLKFAGQNKSRVIVLSIPDWGVMPFARGRDTEEIASEIDLFNSVVREECNIRDIKYFDITGISRRAANDSELVADDGLHPSGKMYSLWVNEIYDEVAALLK